MEGNSSEDSWKNFDDVIKSINSMSKIYNTSKKVEMFNYFCGNHSLEASNLETRSSENNLSDNFFSNFDERREPSGSGRGQYMASLTAKYSQSGRTTELDRVIHEQLQEINGCGYSNYVIEQRFCEPTDYKSFLSSEDISSDLSDDILLSEKTESVDSEQFEDALVEESLQSNENIQCAIDSISFCEASKEIMEDVQTENPTADDHISSTKVQEIKSYAKKNKQRKCRNFVLLNLSGSLSQKKDFKAPKDFLSHSSSFSTATKNQTGYSQTENKDCIFSPENFPTL